MAMEPRANLIAKGGPEDGTVTPLGAGVLSIGRSMMSNIVIDQPGISREHASNRGDAAGYSGLLTMAAVTGHTSTAKNSAQSL